MTQLSLMMLIFLVIVNQGLAQNLTTQEPPASSAATHQPVSPGEDNPMGSRAQEPLGQRTITKPASVLSSCCRGARITLSLDVPTGLLQILIEQARAEAHRTQAALNAQILEQIG
uniref:Corticotropin-releasing factor domain-containing protein n=1 Tax=Sarcophilus harrisii TaxID=9305 RepID=A0A7N4PNF8_SARHA